MKHLKRYWQTAFEKSTGIICPSRCVYRK